jgi:hypothetical protein
MGTDDLAAFLKARLDEDERLVRIRWGDLGWGECRDRREVKAKRAILDEHSPGYPVTYPEPSGQPTCSVCDEGTYDVEPVPWPCPTIRHLAAVYGDHPDYQEEWKP